MNILKLDNISYSYDGRGRVLDNISYEFEKGKVYAIVGRSGAGKTTLLSLLSGLASPTDGGIYFDGKNLSDMDKYDYRSRDVGVIFQSYNLLPHLTAAENVELSMRASGKKIGDRRGEILRLFDRVELDETLADRRVLKLSGGEQQRVAIARALSYRPDVILADEPTGNLDMGTQEEVMEIFKSLAKDENKCVIIVTHSPDVAAEADTVFELPDARPVRKRKKAS